MTPPTRRRAPLAALVALLLLAGGILAVSVNPAHIERDVVQERLDTTGAPLVGPGHTLGQSFISRHAGLRRIELLAVVYNPSREAPPGAQVCLDLERLDDPLTPLVTSCLPVAGIAHNQTLSFDFPPQAGSRDAPYRLTLRSDRDLGLSVWLTDHEAYAGGQAWEDGAPRAGDLYIRTFYNYRLTDALAEAATGLARRAWPIVATLVLLLVPGAAVLVLFPGGRRLEPVVALAVAAALSLAFWPLVLLWATALGLRLCPLGAWSAVVLLACAAAARVAMSRLRGDRPARAPADTSARPCPESAPVGATGRSPLRPPWRRPLLHARDPWPYVALGVVMLLVVVTRALQVRDLVLPAWVDSVHHTMIVRLIADGGRVPVSYRPYMPVDAFHYHFGFHAGAAALAWLAGLTAEQAVLLFGQALNVLAPLSAYTMAWWIGRSRWGGVVAALVVGALCYMPAYYVTWGRYTQLAGLVMLPPLMLLTAWALERRRGMHMGRGDRPVAPTTARRRATSCRCVGLGTIAPTTARGALRLLGAGGTVSLLAALLLAGLVLTHYRVLVFYALWAVPQGALLLWRARGDPSPPTVAPEYWGSPRVRGEGGIGALARVAGQGALCGALALLLALPWVLGFVARVASAFASTYGGWSVGDVGNAFPMALVNVGWTRPLLYLAAVGAVWGLAQRRGEAAVTAVWVGLCLLVANPSLLGLADTWLITNSSVVIAFWLPVGALCGWLAGDLGRLLARARLPRIGRIGRRSVSALLLAAVVALAGVGSWRMVDIVNPVTVLATEEDMDGLAWAREHTPPDALFMVNTGVWQAPMRYGTDAGWWLNVVADRRTTLPSLLYLMGGMEYFEGLNALAIAVEEAESADDPALLERLRAAGVTHVYVGARGGRLLPRDLDPSPHYRALYTHGPVRIYEVMYP